MPTPDHAAMGAQLSDGRTPFARRLSGRCAVTMDGMTTITHRGNSIYVEDHEDGDIILLDLIPLAEDDDAEAATAGLYATWAAKQD
jgi:uncharacterized membrane-anchored protein